ncbi:uncharacterized protein STAUR_5716 [Stigmatella aurantiaca DW4/3-1]|uniref:Lipoprotein n=1 Tax=Stigmatella aurantiaca (strain DW4/3-1) TaxID=378806 RepID=E3FVT8_STIAD|nr:uncharacterized protein STAUR_5716 [Stigmatella aurantiaca DW4/3-1]
MKLVKGILFALSVVAMSACGTQAEMSAAQEGEAALSQQESRQEVGTLAALDCSVSIQCSNGTTRSCSGSSGACSASASGSGSVTCNGVTSSCALTLCSCRADGCCNNTCAADPDCGLSNCPQGAACSSNTQCGSNGRCVSGQCMCLIEP